MATVGDLQTFDIDFGLSARFEKDDFMEGSLLGTNGIMRTWIQEGTNLMQTPIVPPIWHKVLS